ncbi:MAG: tRNA N6-adenosine threonylcarbamoyltransferase [Candidatus Adlerbacteria bacterium]|nr:tRNA N6-adenosine threonylcarbamoyltransferase [Candidatus Adlerbacteria bacterium]
MRVLAIETSCDETGLAVLDGTLEGNKTVFTVVANQLLSQAEMHAEFGGVFPNLAKREHLKNLPILLQALLGDLLPDTEQSLDAIVVTAGPGLEPALWTGIEFAKRIGTAWGKPVFAVNHMEGHLVSSLANKTTEHAFGLEGIEFPVLGLLISGGHTEFVLMKDWFSYEILGQTLDDAIGEAFDKVARMLGLPYPGGPHISKLAEQARVADAKIEVSAAKQKGMEQKSGLPEEGDPRTFDTGLSVKRLPRPMLQMPNCDFSFSGLKTSVLYQVRDLGGTDSLTNEQKLAFAREFEDAVTEVIVSKTRRALEQTDAKVFVIGGGVAANSHIRMALQAMIADEFPNTQVRLPELSITGDNAIMIAEAGLMHLLKGDWSLETPPTDIAAKGTWSVAAALPQPLS